MHWISRPGQPGHLLALATGALAPLTLAPFDYWPLVILSIALLYLGLRDLPGKSALWRGWWHGFGVFDAGTSWIYVGTHGYNAASVPLASFLMLGFTAGAAFFFALPAWLWAHCLRHDSAPLGDALAFAVLWLALEPLHSWFLTGFPWLYTDYSQLQGPLVGLVPVGGVWLSSFVIALSATLPVNLPHLSPHGASLLLGLVLPLGLWAAGFCLKDHARTHSADEPLRIVAIQGNITQELERDPSQVHAQLDLYRDLSLPQQDVDLIIWPETVVPILQDMASSYLGAMDQVAGEENVVLIIGVPVRGRLADGKSRYFNGIIVVGEGAGTYLKQKLVPLGEYVPLQNLLRSLIAFFDLPMSDFVRGPADQPLLKAKSHKIASYICYEVACPEFATALAAQNQVLLTVNNDTWFGTSIGPLRRLQMTQIHTLESGRWTIRAINNSVTSLIDPYGRIVRQIPQLQQDVLRGEIIPMQDLAPYLQYRVWPLAGLAGVLLLWALLGRQLRPQERRLLD